MILRCSGNIALAINRDRISAIQVIDVYWRHFVQATTIHSDSFDRSELIEEFQGEMNSLGFGHWIFSAACHLHELDDAYVTRVSSYPRGFVEDYNKNKFYQVDPSTAYWLSHHKAASYRKVRRSVTLSARQNRLMDLNRDLGVNRGILIPLRNVLGFKSVVALSFDGSIEELNSYITDVEDKILSLSLRFNRHILSRHKSTFLQHSKPLLTAKQTKVIRLVAEGLQTKQVADCLAISINAVDKHIANIKSSLHAKTTASAVALSLQWELI